MVIIQKRSERKPSGARYKRKFSKRLHQKGGMAALTGIGKTKVTAQRVKGGQRKNSVLHTDVVNVFDGKKHLQAKLEKVLENPANRHFIRRNIITKGTLLSTSAGKVQVTNRPGQEGTINGVLVK